MSQTARAVHVAVPPVQGAVSVWVSSRLQMRVWVSSPFARQTPQSWLSAVPFAVKVALVPIAPQAQEA